MTVPTNIPEAPIVHTKHESFQGSKGKTISIATEVLQHVLKTIMNIQDDEEVESFTHWMSFRGFANFTDNYDKYCHILHSILDPSDYKLNGIRCSLTCCTMSKLRMFNKWMATKLTNDDLKLHDDLLTSLTRKQFDNFQHEDI